MPCSLLSHSVHSGLPPSAPALARLLHVWRHLHPLNLAACLARGDMSMALYLAMLYLAALLLMPQVGGPACMVGAMDGCLLSFQLASKRPAGPGAPGASPTCQPALPSSGRSHLLASSSFTCRCDCSEGSITAGSSHAADSSYSYHSPTPITVLLLSQSY
jgi:hypothetical protein